VAGGARGSFHGSLFNYTMRSALVGAALEPLKLVLSVEAGVDVRGLYFQTA
jgi:hypothetical protein